jgi:hypothetical protein
MSPYRGKAIRVVFCAAVVGILLQTACQSDSAVMPGRVPTGNGLKLSRIIGANQDQ